MKETYKVKYRQPGQWFWRTIKNVKGDGVEGLFRFFYTEDDVLIYVSCNAEVVFGKERQAVILSKMSREVGQPIQRA
jgi:hypothetical protein